MKHLSSKQIRAKKKNAFPGSKAKISATSDGINGERKKLFGGRQKETREDPAHY